VVFYNNKSLRQYETDAAQTALRLAGEWSGLADPAGVVGYRQRLREGVEAHLRVSEEEVLRIVRQVIGTCRYLSLLIVTYRYLSLLVVTYRYSSLLIEVLPGDRGQDYQGSCGCRQGRWPAHGCCNGCNNGYCNGCNNGCCIGCCNFVVASR